MCVALYYFLHDFLQILFVEKMPSLKFPGELFSWAAELATEAMKGKLASKYYMQAEEAWAECDVEE